jgi:hypothetical protein
LNAFPKIAEAGISLRYWAENYPNLYYEKSEGITPNGFDKNFRLLGAEFGKEIPNNSWSLLFSEDMLNSTVEFKDNFIIFSGDPIQTVEIEKYTLITMSFNIYNNSDVEDSFNPGYTFLDPARVGLKFLVNPELELWTEGRSQRL